MWEKISCVFFEHLDESSVQLFGISHLVSILVSLEFVKSTHRHSENVHGGVDRSEEFHEKECTNEDLFQSENNERYGYFFRSND